MLLAEKGVTYTCMNVALSSLISWLEVMLCWCEGNDDTRLGLFNLSPVFCEDVANAHPFSHVHVHTVVV